MGLSWDLGASSSGTVEDPWVRSARRTDLILAANPWIANDQEALYQIAGSSVPDAVVATQSAQLYGFEFADRYATSVANLNGPAQRAVFARLTAEQQAVGGAVEDQLAVGMAGRVDGGEVAAAHLDRGAGMEGRPPRVRRDASVKSRCGTDGAGLSHVNEGAIHD